LFVFSNWEEIAIRTLTLAVNSIESLEVDFTITMEHKHVLENNQQQKRSKAIRNQEGIESFRMEVFEELL